MFVRDAPVTEKTAKGRMLPQRSAPKDKET